MRKTLTAITLSIALAPALAAAQASGDIQVDVIHGGNTDMSLTPVWFGFHNGTFDTFNSFETASPALEAIAELGDVGPIMADFTAAPGIPGDIQGVAAAAGNGVPPIEPGETGQGFVTPINPSGYQYFSFLSMVVPTNDTFIGNGDPLAYQVFNDLDQLIDENGVPTNVREIEIFRFYDAGTEVDGGIGAAFQAGAIGTEGVDQNGAVTLNPDLSGFIGVSDVTGRTINDVLVGGELVATIRISQVPEPTAIAMLALSGLGLAVRRR